MNFSAAQRNAAPLLEALLQRIPTSSCGTALEVSSGTGQHLALFASRYTALEWQPSDVDQRLMDSVRQHTAHMSNVLPPVHLDASSPDWSQQLPCLQASSVQLVININMVHITPWSCARGLFRGAGQLLKPGGCLMTYGPYAKDGVLTPQSNVNFDATLRSQNPEWGVRDIRDLQKEATENGLVLDAEVDMPANNKCLFWKKS